MEKKEQTLGIVMLMGIIIGTVVGAVPGNVGFWIAMGTAIGLLIGAVIVNQAAEDKLRSEPHSQRRRI